MYGNPAEEWLRLAQRYRSMSEAELRKLIRGFAALTPTAQLVLRDEIKLRGWSDPQAPGPARGSASAPRKQESLLARAAIALAGRPPQPAAGNSPTRHPASEQIEYTWKTLLCRCDSRQQAWQIFEVLRRAGIESWVEGPQTYAYTSGSEHTAAFDFGSQRVLVAADQLDEARVIASQPIPADIVELSRTPVPPYQLPVCPRCGAADPILEDVDPVNAWRCESCAAEWCDPGPAADQES